MRVGEETTLLNYGDGEDYGARLYVIKEIRVQEIFGTEGPVIDG